VSTTFGTKIHCHQSEHKQQLNFNKLKVEDMRHKTAERPQSRHLLTADVEVFLQFRVISDLKLQLSCSNSS